MYLKIKNRVSRFVAFAMLLTVLSLSVSAFFPISCNAASGEQGIDVSFWQGNIDWNQVAASGVTFAFIRLGNLKTGLDPYFYQNMLGAQAVGIKTGVYIYSSAMSMEEVGLEALFVLQALQNISVSFPVVYDIESDMQAVLPKDTLSLFANTFCAILEQQGYYPMVYANTNWFQKKLGPIVYDKWVAQWSDHCDIPDACIWQYTAKATVPGISGHNMDRDLMIKDYTPMFVHTGFVNRNGYIYFLSNYKVYKGLLDLGTTKFFLDENGHLYTGFLPYGDSFFFFKEDGQMAVGFTPIGDGIYFFGPDGLMKKGLQDLGVGTYFFDNTGKMYTGFLTAADGLRYFSAEGIMAKGLYPIGNKLYYFDEKTGLMKTGICDIGADLFLFDTNGALYTGWFNDGINKYYFDPAKGGAMAKGLITIDNAIYYFDEASGIMTTGLTLVGGTPLFFDIDGKLLPDVVQ